MKFLIVCACLLVTLSQARKLPQSALSLKYQKLNYFENDADLKLRDDETDDKTPVLFAGDIMKAKTSYQENLNQGKGRFKYTLDTENGISVQQAGKLKDNKTFVVQGSYSYTGADGRRYRVKYTADEFGYHPITELEIDIPDLDTNQVDTQKPKVNPYKFSDRTPPPPPTRPPPRTPPPRTPPPPPPRPVAPPAPVNRFGQDDQIDFNPFGNPGPYIADRYLPPATYLPPTTAPPTYLPPHNDYLPPQNNYLPPQNDYLPPQNDYHAAASSPFRYT